jgi:putative hydroxymethylpyrimidine transport system substrate-binding protein
VRRLAALLMASVAVAGCGQRDQTTTATSESPVSVVVPAGAASAASIAAAEKQGLFRSAGLAVKVQAGAGGEAAALDSVSGGRAQLAVASEPAVLQARNRGLQVVSVAALVHGPRVAVVSTQAVDNPRDLSGKKLGYFGGPYVQAFAKTLSARAGGGGIDVVSVPDPSKALQKHTVDAVIGPKGQVKVKKAKAVTVDRLGIPTYDEEVLVAQQGIESDRADDVRGFIGALWHQAGGKAPGPQSASQWRAFAEWMEANGLLKGQPNGAAAMTNDLLPGLPS